MAERITAENINLGNLSGEVIKIVGYRNAFLVVIPVIFVILAILYIVLKAKEREKAECQIDRRDVYIEVRYAEEPTIRGEKGKGDVIGKEREESTSTMEKT